MLLRKFLNWLRKEEAKQSIAYYRANAEEDYINTPISVLRYSAELQREHGMPTGLPYSSTYFATAVFVGEDGSLGYRYGQGYILKITQIRDSMEIHISHLVSPQQYSYDKRCVYSSLAKFFQNWGNVSQMK